MPLRVNHRKWSHDCCMMTSDPWGIFACMFASPPGLLLLTLYFWFWKAWYAKFRHL